MILFSDSFLFEYFRCLIFILLIRCFVNSFFLFLLVFLFLLFWICEKNEKNYLNFILFFFLVNEIQIRENFYFLLFFSYWFLNEIRLFIHIFICF